MRLSFKLVIAMLFVAAAPIGLAGYQALGLSRTELEERIREILAKSSTAEAEIVGRDIASVRTTIKLAASGLLPDPENLTGLSESLSRVYLLSERFNAVGLFDKHGEQVGPAIFVDDYAAFGEEYRSHQDLNAKELEVFLEQAARFQPGKAACSSRSLHGSSRTSAIGMICAAPVVDTTGRRLWLATEVSLNVLQIRFETFRAGRTGFAFLVDAKGSLVFHRDTNRALARQSVSELPLIKTRLGSSNPSVSEYIDPALGPMVGAYAPVRGMDWAVVVTQPQPEALRPVERLGKQLATWLLVGLVVATLLGWFLARRIVRPVRQLVFGANALAEGKLEYKIHVSSKDEIGHLGQTFNHMGTQLFLQREKIQSQTEEIRSWNAELQHRVDDRTRELEETQDLLIQAQKMAAVGELGAGMAHEINNPLMGVIGCAQLMLMKRTESDPEFGMLRDIETGGKRIQEIVSSLLEASQTGTAGTGRIHLDRILQAVTQGAKEELSAKGIQVELELAADLPPIQGNPGSLQAAIAELVTNACHAMPHGGTIRVAAEGTEGELVRITVSDDGTGIPEEIQERIFEPFFTTKQNWEGKGLGLSTVFQTVEAHHGKISLTSEAGRGATFQIALPALRSATHLR